MESCLKCINSACCKLVVELSKDEFDKTDNEIKSRVVKYTDEFISKFPKFEDKREYLDDMYKSNYGYIEKGEDGSCVFLDRKTMLCSIYEKRPKACQGYQLNRCEKIREICIN